MLVRAVIRYVSVSCLRKDQILNFRCFGASPETFFSGADKNIENDEPLFFSSSSDEEQDEDEPISEEVNKHEDASQPTNPRKRPAGGHTPLDLAKCQKVSNIALQSKVLVLWC